MFLALASLSYYIASRGDSSVTHHGKAAKKSHYASIPLSKACCEDLGALQASLAGQARHLNLRASGLHGVHFTLAVFKIENRKEETEETLTHTINKVLKDFLNQRPPVILTFGGVGNFGPHIVHIKIVKTKALEDLHRDMIECLKEEGVYIADDRFSPHVTLFRGRQRGGQGHSKDRSRGSVSASNLTTQELVGKDRSRGSVSASNLTTQELVGKERSKESESASNLTTQELVGKNRSRNSVSASNLPLHNLVTRPDLPSVTSSTVTEILFKKLRS